MKKLRMASVALTIVLGMTQMNANSATNNGVATSVSKSAVKNYNLVEAGRVSARTQGRFNQEFGNSSSAVWEKSGTLDKVTFVKDGEKRMAYYNKDSKLVGTGSEGIAAGMPAQAVAGLKSQYKAYTVGSVIFFDRNEANAISKLVYGTKLKEESYLVELNGEGKKIIVEVKVKGETAVISNI